MIYWSANSVPELKGLERKEQNHLFKACMKEGRRRMGNEFWIRLAIAIVLDVVIGFIWPLGGFIGALLLGLSVGFVIVLLAQSPSIDAGRVWLREQGYPKSAA